MKNINVSSSLFANPSLVEGFSRLIDLGVTLQEYNTSDTEQEADMKAIERDWLFVGADLRSSINRYGQEPTKSI